VAKWFSREMIRIITDKCTGCGLCITACPYDAVKLEDGVAVFLENCTSCGACAEACEFEAIEIERTENGGLKTETEKHRGVWVFGELLDDEVHPVVFELLDKGREIADELGTELGIVLLGRKIGDHVRQLSKHGADNVYVVDNEMLADFNTEPYTSAVVKLVLKYRPEIFLAGSTSLGRTLFPRVAARLKTGLTADCTGLDADDGLLVQTRPAFGGNIMATILCKNKRPQMATVRHKALKPRDKSRRTKVKVIKERFSKAELASRTRVVEFIEGVTQAVNLDSAEIIVAGGMGLGSPDNFRLIQELAEAIGGAVGSSRPPIDRGWIPYSHQIGQTGKTVRPKAYIACGISGAIQHLAGMSSSDKIIAINKDRNAPIFDVADIGIVGDLLDIVPRLTERLRVGRTNVIEEIEY
jgi:electron transfer flavoprotein alpha subunit